MKTALLNVTNLACSRGGLTVFEGVHFSVLTGQAVLVRGPNGSGKTTLLRAIAGLQMPDAGAIECKPESIAYATHADGIKATLTVRENLQFWADLFGASSIDRAIETFDLTALLSRPARALSAGQRRRAGLARLMVSGRLIWVLDEPTASLDVGASGLLVAAVEQHLASGGCAVIATHDNIGLEGGSLDMSQFRPSEAADGAFDMAFT